MPEEPHPLASTIPPGVDGFTDPSDPRYYGHSRFMIRLWHGMTTWAWFRFLRGHLKDVSPSRYGLVLSVTLMSFSNSFFALMERLFYGRKIAQVDLRDDPVLIIGFQRSGTTFLNELLACDPRFAYPDNIHCFQPENFLVTEKTLRPLAKMAPDSKRPMDDVDVAHDAPQEDEVALLLMGIPSPYKTMAFPLGLEEYRKSLQEEHEDPRKTQAWIKAWCRFLSKVQYANGGKRLLLKSPTHTVRVMRILSQFPNAKFIHITRDPYKIFLSNVKLGFALTATQGLQTNSFDLVRMEEELLSGFTMFHEAYAQQKPDIPEGQLITIAYEDLVEDPVAQLKRIYAELDLGDFAPVEEPLQTYLDARQSYRTNAYVEIPDVIDKINDRWDHYFKEYGYTKREPKGSEQADSVAKA